MATVEKPRCRSDEWIEVVRPVGEFETPSWCGGVHVDFMLGYANSPRVLFKEVGPMPTMGEWQRERVDGSVRWFRTAADGSLMEQYWHAGALTRLDDGSYETTKQDGFGGRAFTLTNVAELGTVHLRGPWFGGTAKGFNEMTTVDMRNPGKHAPYYRDKPWHKRGGCFGLYISDDMLIRLLSRFAPHYPLAWVEPYTGAGPRVEPFEAEWGCPKRLRSENPNGE